MSKRFDPRRFGIPAVETRNGFTATLKKTEKGSGRPGITILTAEQKTSITYAIIKEEFTSEEVAETLNLDVTTPRRWVKKLTDLQAEGYEKPGLSKGSLGGNNFAIDGSAAEKYEEQIAKKHKKNDCVKADSNDATSLFLHAHFDSCDQRGAASLKTSFDPRTIVKTQQRLNISQTKGRSISEARVIAVDDPRNAVTHAVAMDVHCKGRLDALKGNFDFTQFLGLATDNGDGKVLVAKSNGNHVEARKCQPGESCIFVKYLSVYFCNGYAASPVFVVANENIAENSFLVERVPLMTQSDDPSHFGYLFWSKTRGFGVNSFVWVWVNVIFPVIDELRKSCCLNKDDEDYITRAAFTFIQDGEAQGIEATQNPDVIKHCQENFINLLKSAQSCSLIQQLCDLATIYRDTKSDLATIQVDDYRNDALSSHLNNAMDKNQDTLKYTSGEKQKLNTIMLKIVAVLKKHVTHKAIVSAAKKAGMVGPTATWDSVTRRISFQASTHDWKGGEMKHILEKWEELKTLWNDKGELPDRDLDDLGIVRGTHDKHQGFKEDLVEYRRRTTWLNHCHMIADIARRREAKAVEAVRKADAKIMKEQQGAAKLITEPLLVNMKSILDESKKLLKEVEAHTEKCRRFHIDSKNAKKDLCILDYAKSLREECEKIHEDAKGVSKTMSERFHLATDAAKKQEVDIVTTSLQEFANMKQQIMESKLEASLKEDNIQAAPSPTPQLPTPASSSGSSKPKRSSRKQVQSVSQSSGGVGEFGTILPLLGLTNLTPQQRLQLLAALQEEGQG